MLVPFILLAIAVIVMHAPQPYGSWISLALAICALILACVRHQGVVW